MRSVPIGVMYRCDNQPETLSSYARLVERLGFDELWVVEDCFFGGGISSAAVAVTVTERLRIGLGILPAAFRNPALAAMELGNLERMFPGRILPGFGHGVSDWVRQVGADHPSPLTVLGETVDAVRALLAGKTVTVSGRHARLTDVALESPPVTPPPVATGVRGPKSLRLSGAVADGTILAEGASPAYVRWARTMIDEGRLSAGRADHHRVTVYTDFDFDSARTSARLEIARRLRQTGGLAAADADLADEVSTLLATTDGLEALAAALPEAYLDRFAVAGTPEQCTAAMTALVKAGADAVILVPPRDAQLAVAQITLAADQLLPHIR